MYAHEFEPRRKLVDYAGGIQDTLEGSHGPNFTDLPVVDEDDCQVYAGQNRLEQSESVRYEGRVTLVR